MALPPTIKCEACQTELSYRVRMNIAVRDHLRVKRAPDGERREIEDFFKTPIFRCNQCGQKLQLHLEISFLGVSLIEQVEGQPMQEEEKYTPHSMPRRVIFSEAQISILNLAHATGLFNAYKEAASMVLRGRRVRFAEKPPRIQDVHFLKFLEKAVLGKVSSRLFDELLQQEAGSSVQRTQLWHASSVGMIVVNDEIRRFMPMWILKDVRSALHSQEQAQKLRIGGHVVGGRDAGDVRKLIRTSFGYVPADQRIFLEALRHTLGHRGHEMQSIPLSKTKGH